MTKEKILTKLKPKEVESSSSIYCHLCQTKDGLFITIFPQRIEYTCIKCLKKVYPSLWGITNEKYDLY